MHFEISINSTENWKTGGNGLIKITNTGETVKDWQFQLSTSEFIIQQFWQLEKSGNGNNITIKPPNWKPNLNSGETLVSGFGYTNSAPINNLKVTSSTGGINIITNTSEPTKPPIPTPTNPPKPTPTTPPKPNPTLSGPPGKNYNLKNWKLQLPLKGKKTIQEISGDELTAGYTSKYFYTRNDGSIAFWCASDGYTTPNSHNPRSELREMPNNGNWTLSGKHVLRAEFAIINFPSNQKGIIVGQIHGDNNALNPQLCKLYWKPDGSFIAQVKNDDNPSGTQTNLLLGKYNIGDKISYVIFVDDHQLTVSATNIKNGIPVTITQKTSFRNSYWDKQTYYFKAGNYFQVNTVNPVNASLVQFYSIQLNHS